MTDRARDAAKEWEELWGKMHALYEDECERVDRLRAALETCAEEFDKLGETRMAKFARARKADA